MGVLPRGTKSQPFCAVQAEMSGTACLLWASAERIWSLWVVGWSFTRGIMRQWHRSCSSRQFGCTCFGTPCAECESPPSFCCNCGSSGQWPKHSALTLTVAAWFPIVPHGRSFIFRAHNSSLGADKTHAWQCIDGDVMSSSSYLSIVDVMIIC